MRIIDKEPTIIPKIHVIDVTFGIRPPECFYNNPHVQTAMELPIVREIVGCGLYTCPVGDELRVICDGASIICGKNSIECRLANNADTSLNDLLI